MLREDLRPAGTTLSQPIVAWRAWTAFARKDWSKPRLLPIAGDTHPWPPLEPACGSCRRRRFHQVPGLDCTCGLYAVREAHLLRRTRDPAAVGTVALWGRVVEHELGYRAEFAYPQRLRLICHLCFWQRDLRSSAPDVVARARRGRLIPLCGDHVALSNRYGYRTLDLAPANEIQQALLSVYAVDLLPG